MWLTQRNCLIIADTMLGQGEEGRKRENGRSEMEDDRELRTENCGTLDQTPANSQLAVHNAELLVHPEGVEPPTVRSEV